jgi:hypothetical protein
MPEAVALLDGLDVDKETHAGLTTLLRTPGPGSWSHVAHLRVGRRGLTIRDLWTQVAPTRRLPTRPADFIRDMSRGRPLRAHREELAANPERIFEVFPLLVAIAAELPEKPTDLPPAA